MQLDDRRVTSPRSVRVPPGCPFAFDSLIPDLSFYLACPALEAPALPAEHLGEAGPRVPPRQDRHTNRRRSTVQQRPYTDFVYRRVSGAGFTIRHGFLLHNAVVVAWNRPWT